MKELFVIIYLLVGLFVIFKLKGLVFKSKTFQFYLGLKINLRKKYKIHQNFATRIPNHNSYSKTYNIKKIIITNMKKEKK